MLQVRNFRSCRRSRLLRSRRGFVLEQAAMIASVVLTVAAATPAMIALFKDHFYRISSIVANPFT